MARVNPSFLVMPDTAGRKTTVLPLARRLLAPGIAAKRTSSPGSRTGWPGARSGQLAPGAVAVLVQTPCQAGAAQPPLVLLMPSARTPIARRTTRASTRKRSGRVAMTSAAGKGAPLARRVKAA